MRKLLHGSRICTGLNRFCHRCLDPLIGSRTHSPYRVADIICHQKAYVMASRRAGTWLIPAFHAAIDEGISDGHDDPQHFSLEAFDMALTSLLQALRR